MGSTIEASYQGPSLDIVLCDDVEGRRRVSSKSSKPTHTTDYFFLTKPRRMDRIIWDDEDGEDWWVEQTQQYQVLQYESPVGGETQPTPPVPAVEVDTRSPPAPGEEVTMGDAGLVTLREEVVVEETQRDSDGDEDGIWGTA